jgi:uncharacterized membrane protein
MTIETPGAAAPKSRWLFAGLIASMALNLLFIGWFGSAMWHHRKDPTWRGGEPGLMGFVRKLPEDRRPALRARLKQARETIKPFKAELDTAWTAANAALAADPFDKAAAKTAFDTAIAADAKLRAAIDDELIATAEGLSADERKLLQEWREKRKPRMLRHHRRRNKDKAEESAAPEPAAGPN